MYSDGRRLLGFRLATAMKPLKNQVEEQKENYATP